MIIKVAAGLLAVFALTVAGLLLYSHWTFNSGPFFYFSQSFNGHVAGKTKGMKAIRKLLDGNPSEVIGIGFMTKAGFTCSGIDHSEVGDQKAWQYYRNAYKANLDRILRCKYDYGLPGIFGNSWEVDMYLDEEGKISGYRQLDRCGVCF